MTAATGRPNPPTRWLWGAAIVFALAVAGCTGGSPTPDNPAATSQAPAAAQTPAATPVPPPTPGTVHSTVPSRPVKTRPTVGFDRASSPRQGVEISVSKQQAIARQTTNVPGEVAGPAIAFTIDVKNSGSKAVTLDDVVVDLTDAKGQVSDRITSAPASPLGGSLKPGASSEGVYIFRVPKNARSKVVLRVGLDPQSASVVFAGRGAR